MNLILNDLESNNAAPKNIVLDDLIVPPYTAAKYARFYWRFEDEPTAPFQYLGQQTVGFAFQTPVAASGREIRISMIGVSSDAVASVTDPREGVQTTIYIPTAAETIVMYDGEIVYYNGEIVTYG